MPEHARMILMDQTRKNIELQKIFWGHYKMPHMVTKIYKLRP